MSKDSTLLKQLEANLLDQDRDAAEATAREIIASEINVLEAIDVASDTITKIGEQFQCGELFLPQLMLAGEAMKACMEVLSQHLGSEHEAESKGKVVICAVSGDIHDIGKNLVSSMLSVNGYEVVDIGVNVAPMEIADTAQKERAKFIALSSLMTTSMPYQQDVLDLLKELGVREEFYVIVGGGPVTPEFARDIGADGWGLSAVSAVQVCDDLIESHPQPSSGNLVIKE